MRLIWQRLGADIRERLVAHRRFRRMPSCFRRIATALVLLMPCATRPESTAPALDIDPEWQAATERLLSTSELRSLLPHPDDRRARLEMYRWVLHSLVDGYELFVAMDKDFPLWTSRFLNFPNPSIGTNPDTYYQSTVVEESGIYRIWGNRGTTHSFAVQLGTALGVQGNEALSRTLTVYSVDDLQLDANGAFSVTLSAQRPPDLEGDWWQLKPGSGFAFARQVAYDWRTEELGSLHIERLNPSRPKPLRASADEVSTQIDSVMRFAIANARTWLDHVAKLRRDGIVNRLRMNPMLDIGGWDKQRYWEGAFDIAADDVLLVTIALPEQLDYWNIQLSSDTWETLDSFNRISSVNGSQARRASDGKIYVVIAHEDPGVPNWLDTGGYDTGHMYGRWNNASSHPLPMVRKLKLAELRAALPTDTTRVTPQERADEIAWRRRAAQRLYGF
jgi:Protein of unknown function (DUF1214)